MEWSNYQKAVFDAVKNTDEHIVVQATAGSGKTTVLVEIANLLPPNLACRFLAFNKIIADELGERLPAHFPSSTIHSYGFSQLKKVGNKFKVDGYKLHKICDAAARVVPFDDGDEQERFAVELRELINMVRLCRVDVTDERAMTELAWERGLIYEPEITNIYSAIMQVIDFVATEVRDVTRLSQFANVIVGKLKTSGWNSTNAIPASRWIDFTDMVALPLNWNLINPDHDFILWDEAQDGNSLYFEFIQKSLKAGGRLVAVGDDKQNIMGFGGAFLDGMTTIKSVMGATEYPLSVSYRCPTSHVKLANTVFSGTESPEWAKEGILREIDDISLLDETERIYRAGGSILIMCRKNAPTIRFAMRLLQRRIPAKVKGRDFCTGIKSVIKKCGKKFADFDKNLSSWHSKERNRLLAKRAGELAFQSLDDKYKSIQILYDTSDAQSLDEFIGEVDTLFSDGGDKIQLASVHKSKGVECENTAILEYDKLPMTWNDQTAAQAHAENCVHFVATTRSKNTMYLCK